MILRWLFIALILYFLYRFVTKRLRARVQTMFRGNNPFDPNQQSQGSNRKEKNFDQIEEAEYEDITDKEKKEYNP